MIIIPPDNKSQDTVVPRREEEPPESLPGPPPAGPSRKPTNHVRKRRLRLVACAAILLSLAFIIHTTRRANRPHLFRPRKKLFAFDKPREPEALFNPKKLLEVEKTFLAVPNNDSAIEASRKFAGKPHLAGSEQDIETAYMMLDVFQTQLGIAKPEDPPVFDAGSRQSQRAIRGTTTVPRRISQPIAWIDTYYPVLNTGVEQRLEILDKDGSATWSADLWEDGDSADPDAARYRNAVPPWHGLSKDGEAIGPVVYVKYGRKEDFDSLVASGVNLHGTIALVRYGGVFRGLKVKAAQEAGCIGVLIYSDPHDDGSVTESNGYQHWPHGPARNPTSVQRGSVQFLSSYPGDPTTPGYPAYKNATRMEATSIPSIPSLPISWNNAQKLFAEIGTSTTSVKKIRLLNKVDDRVIPIYNTMAVIPGIVPEQAVVVGNHRDAWVMGAADPTSGTVSLHELVRGLGALLRTGWRPFRTIILASWDAEEYGLVGSTEWGEDFADWIQAHVVAYLNLDVSVSGSRYNLKGSPSLAHLIMDAAMSVPHPKNPNLTLWDARLERGPFTGPAFANDPISELVQERMEAETSVEQDDIPVNALGSGSDYTVMLQRLGIASTDMGFGSTLSDAVYHYHSIYDTQTFQETYVDATFDKHVAVAQHLGLMMLRLSESPILPINTTHYSLELFKYLQDVNNSASKNGISLDTSHLKSALDKLLEKSLRLDNVRDGLLENLNRAHADREQFVNAMVHEVKTWVHRKLGFKRKHLHKDELKHLEQFFEMQAYVLAPEHAPAVTLYEPPMNITDLVPHPLPDGLANELAESMMRIRETNIRLGRFEQGFLSESGIKDREWYRHLGVAPGKWKGYGATRFPALSEAIEIDKNATLASQEVVRLVEVVETLIDTLTLS